jgi:threonine synthase
VRRRRYGLIVSKRPTPAAFSLTRHADLSRQTVRLPLHFISTRGDAPRLTFDDAVLAGLARDGGLYVPEAWPTLSPETIRGFAGRPFHEIATAVIEPYTGGTITRADLGRMAREAYSAFPHPATTPLVQIAPETFVLELFHGPTLAFKDVAMQLLARLMDHILSRRGRRATIVGATSGDTGGAAVEAFRGSANVDVVILFPAGRVSDVQRRMMTTPEDANIFAVEIDGTFDDCQALVKAMFVDPTFVSRVALAGVNSINWARIVAQMSYYFAASAALGGPDRKVTFAVPTGNFGDIFAGYAAKRMGLPIERLVIASNDNDILPRTVATGVYEKAGVVATTSPSMDIQVSSNFERYLFEAQGRDAGRIRGQMAALGQSGRFELPAAAHAALQRDMGAAAATEADVARVIRRVLAETAYLIEPHTACAVAALDRLAAELSGPKVVLATAHPAKFPDAMEAITGERPALPARLAGLMAAPERMTRLPNDLAAVKAFVEGRSHATAGVRA